MSFDLENPYLDIEVDDLVLGLYETEGVRKITELSRQVRSLLNLKTNTIRYRFSSNSIIHANLKDVTFYEDKKQFESLALRFIKGSTFIDNKIVQIENLKQTTLGIPMNRHTTNLLYCCLYFVTISAFVSGTSYWYFGIIPFGIVFFLNYSTYAKNKRIESKPDNIYVNNVEV